MNKLPRNRQLPSRILGLILTAVVWLTGSINAQAQAQAQASGSDGGETRYYVEILVFQRLNAQEALYRFPGEPDVSQALDLWPISSNPGFARPRPQPEISAFPLRPVTDLFVAMPEQQLVMSREWRAVSAEPGLQPLAQRGWHQPAASFGDPQPVRVHGGAVVDSIVRDNAALLLGSVARTPVYAVDGTAALERGRFLHLRIDLAMHLKDRRGAPHYGDLQTLEQPGNYTTHRISERRQVTLNAVNYFDHAFFGVVALVKLWPPEGGEQRENP